MYIARSAILSITICILLITSDKELYAADNIKRQVLLYPALVNKFYSANAEQLFWFGESSSKDMSSLLLRLIDSSAYLGLNRSTYHCGRLHEIVEGKMKRGDSLMQLDRLFTDAAIAYCKDIYQGTGIRNLIKYDEWSVKYEDIDNNYVISHLLSVRTPNQLLMFINSLEPSANEYLGYKNELRTQLYKGNAAKVKQDAISMNFYRWIYHFKFPRHIVVNIGSASLRYYENNEVRIYSKVIVGKPSTKTPRFAAQCGQAILYPYWNVPLSIEMKELLPKYKKNPGLIDAQNMQVVDKNGHVVNHYTLNWSKFSRSYFPYRLRQSTGCDNSLGVIKFDLTSPFGVYLHDTNTKGLFASNNRYRSHGCIRVEKALELGNYLLNNKLDTTYLQKCMKDQAPVYIKLDKSVPVFVIYNTVQTDSSGKLVYYKDVYHLL